MIPFTGPIDSGRVIYRDQLPTPIRIVGAPNESIPF